MLIRSDFSNREVVLEKNYDWVNSPIKDVKRMMLDRIGDEVAKATSIVRYEPNSSFPEHEHSGGEEFFVLEGQFEDENGVYPKGCYVRNPIGSKHTPKVGEKGATIFVKLRQFSLEDKTQIAIDTNSQKWLPGLVKGLEVMPLYSFESENIALVKWGPNTKFQAHNHYGGEEIFVLSGTFHDEHGIYPKGSWIRSPHMSKHNPYTKSDGATIFVKTGHLI